MLLSPTSLAVTLFLTSYTAFHRFLAALSPPAAPCQPPPLTASSSNTFTIAVFSDLHYGEEENGWGIDQDIKSTRATSTLLDLERPDLVVLNGDLVTGENTFRHNASHYVHQIVAPMVARRVPWASTYGNHDSKFNLSRDDLLRQERRYPLLSHTAPGYTPGFGGASAKGAARSPGVTNYRLLVLGHGIGGIPTPRAVLWFFDSRGGCAYQSDRSDRDNLPNWVDPRAARWFASEHARLRDEFGPLPSVAFVHIPPAAFLAAQERGGVAGGRFPGTNDDMPVDIQGDGHQDRAFMDALRRAEGLNSVYVGHDHGNAWCATWPGSTRRKREGPFLCFGKHTGYGGYGNWHRGARMVRLSFPDDGPAGMEVETWVRLEDGRVVTRVNLNETYGRDIYPTDDGE